MEGHAMIPELGLFALTLAFAISLLQTFLPFSNRYSPTLIRSAAIAQWFCITVAFGSLIFLFADSDFSVLSVVQNSHLDKPMIYKITGAWGHHEGSMLLWVWVLSLFGAWLAGNRHGSRELQIKTLSVQGALAAGFLLFILLTSNPFARVFPVPPNGEDLNPLLQDIGLAIHPPMLYLGYVGFSIVFSLAVAGLWRGQINREWAAEAQPWILLSWCSLTLGIGLGSWWAYRELGWGGWWFWDPVENASLMPWLAGTALLHVNLVLLRRNCMAKWVAFLAILTFSLSLLGTFLVRSGVLTSVHSFANDPARGLLILAYIVITTGGALWLFAWRSPVINPNERALSPLSREGSILINNLFMLTACFAILLATLYPLFLDWLTQERVSVGPPYFEKSVIPIMVPAIFLAAVAPLLAWRKAIFKPLLSTLASPFIISFTAGVLAWHYAPASPAFTALGFWLAAWLAASVLAALARRTHLFRQPLATTFSEWKRLPLSYHGMAASHLGVAVMVAGITASSLWQVEKELPVKPLDKITVGQFTLHYEKEDSSKRDNYLALQGLFRVWQDDRELASLTPEVRYYPVRATRTVESSIFSTWAFDLYAVLERVNEEASSRTRIYFTPLMNWIWAGFLLMTLGGGLSFWYYRRQNLRKSFS